ncbi:hypothetical protein [Actinocatenispora rupis]|uniref:hypothetical protein n=1 Tax=Actinocatenispora rupis TaxID=519421 RepID=UPI001943C8F2|nr:hypothetical protein [Actinocatenispora rupis]
MGDNRSRFGRGSPLRVVLVAAPVVLVVVVAVLVAWRVLVFGMLELHFGAGFDARRFDTLESQFDHRRTAFARADARMRQLAAAHPRAERIAWTMAMICVRDAGRAETCASPSPRDRATYDGLWGVDVIVRQSHDRGRTFFKLYGEDPPRYTIMRAPDGTDVDEYADDRGFRSTRDLTPGWTILGPIPDLDRENAQWQE